MSSDVTPIGVRPHVVVTVDPRAPLNSHAAQLQERAETIVDFKVDRLNIDPVTAARSFGIYQHSVMSALPQGACVDRDEEA